MSPKSCNTALTREGPKLDGGIRAATEQEVLPRVMPKAPHRTMLAIVLLHPLWAAHITASALAMVLLCHGMVGIWTLSSHGTGEAPLEDRAII
mmetsp:Transcript_70832/g.125058  ORF Transcript_70832/g.125058 Transcript_70832/m.125058 type:complete len:93 (-) Transcript_70832:586-864(-)